MRTGSTLIGHSIAVVELLATEAREMRFADIASRLKLPKSSAHILLSTLTACGWIEQNPDTGFYRLALRFAVMGQRFLVGMGFSAICQPVLDRLARDSGELARLAIVEGETLTWIAHAQGARSGLVYLPPVTPLVALHATANGRAWLATLPRERAIKIILEAGFGRPEDHGPAVVRTMDAFIRALDRTAELGYGLVEEEAKAGVTAIAAAIRPNDGPAVGTVSVAGPVIRVTRERVPELARVVTAAADDLATLWPLRMALQRPPGTPD